MNTIACPHCGKEMYEKLDTCPHCGGPVMSEALHKEIRQVAAEYCEKVRADEKKWLLLSSVGGPLAAIFIVISGYDASNSIFFYIFIILAFGCLLAAWFFGLHSLHPVRRWGIVLTAIFGWLVGYFGGIFYWFPRGLFRFFSKKPLLTDEEILNMYDKGLLK